MACDHTYLQLDPSPFAELAGFEQLDARKRAAAETTTGKSVNNFREWPNTLFPGPLVLPHDDLNYDPDCPPQSYRSWSVEKARNRLTNRSRNTIYIGRVPQIAQEMSFMQQWTRPNVGQTTGSEISSPDAALFVEYTKAFYHGMDVQMLPQQLAWKPWDKSDRPKRQVNLPKYVGLSSATGATTRIRVRRVSDNTFDAQLNLDDIIDTAISILPSNAYALLLLVDHDIYESDDDDFCCGRAYGGSRVAVVQTARYNPALDTREAIDRSHMWPMSHCKAFIDDLCLVEDVAARDPTKEQINGSKKGAMRKAIDAAAACSGSGDKQMEIQALWFARLARTVSHELGHCFGIAHCVYYACNMQSTAGMKEDVRQPPYLCPVCEAKVYNALVKELDSGEGEDKSSWTAERCVALKNFCQGLDSKGLQSSMWAGLEAWLSARV
ncbi:Archaemetzincin-1 [Curvularia kusanoi]|uniref:Archaemetzincin-1 n=1 Tax=Curvularia kusanoi TaxID=90978 RepID=A0A9P4WAU8_CURKU|nr:Archaemetzincin-1 [Curvularia kusanoi]